MSADIETVLRNTLTARADLRIDAADPWQHFVAGERRHRRNRRLRIGAGAVVGVTALGLAGAGFIPVPSWTPAITLEQATSPLREEPTKGSLADDVGWLAEFRETVPALLAETWAGDSDGHWRVEDTGEVRVLFAGDVFDDRLVVAVVPLRIGLLRAETTVWFRGPAGAAPAELHEDGSSGALTTASVSRLDVEDGVGHALVLAPAGTRAEVSGGVTYRADGTIERSWTELTTAPSGEIAGTVPVRGQAHALRIALPGGDFEPDNWHMQGGEVLGLEEFEALVDQATSELDAAHRHLAGAVLPFALAEAGLDWNATTVTTLWAGEVQGQSALLVAAQPRDGGVLLFAPREAVPTGGGGEQVSQLELRLLAPADGAYSRPYAWRVRAEEDDTAESGTVVVVAPSTADRVEIQRADATTIPVSIDSTGTGTAELPEADRATVIAYAEDGRVLGETPIPPLDTGYSPIPGETEATSVVLAAH